MQKKHVRRLLLMSALTAVTARAAVLESPVLQVTVDEDTGALTIRDRENGRTWRHQVDAAAPVRVHGEVVANSDTSVTLPLMLPGTRGPDATEVACAVTVALGPEARDVTLRFAPDRNAAFETLLFPYALVSDLDDPRVVLPHNCGLLLPARDDHPDYIAHGWNEAGLVYHTPGLANACVGLSDGGTGAGMMLVFATPYRAGFRLLHVPMPGGVNLRVPTVVWHADANGVGPVRELVIHVSSSGGYVALAKRYRRHLAREGRLITLAEKQRAHPAATGAVGAPVFWLTATGHPDSMLTIARAMREDGFERAIVNLHSTFYDRVGRPDWAAALVPVVRGIRELGYVVSCYDQYRDTHPYDPSRTVFQQWHTDVYNTAGTREADGAYRAGFGPEARVIRADVAEDLARRRIPARLERYGFNGYFIDCYGFVAPLKDVDFSPGRTLNVDNVLACRQRVFRLVTDHGALAGTEASADWVVPWVVWTEGSLTINTMAGGGAPGWGYTPEWRFYRGQLSPACRIPFNALAVGDCITRTWRWSDGLDRYPRYWQQRNLWTLLHGGVPVFSLSLDGYMAHRERMRHLARYVCPWSARVADREMLEHRVLTPDRLVQESVWADGGDRIGVVVNLDRRERRLPGLPTLPGLDYLTYRQANGERTWSEPPVKAMDYDYRVPEFAQLTEGFEAGFGGIVRAALSRDRAQPRGVRAEPACAITGAHAMVGANRNPDQRWNHVMKTRPYVVPFLAGRTYEVAFDWRAVDHQPGLRIYCSVTSSAGYAGGVAARPKQDGETGSAAFRFVAPEAADTTVTWGFEGLGTVSFDTLRLTCLDTLEGPGEKP